MKLLEDAMEDMSTTFLGLSDTLLKSRHVRTRPELVVALGESVRHILTITESVNRSVNEESDDRSGDDRGDALGSSREAMRPSDFGDSLSKVTNTSSAQGLPQNPVGFQNHSPIALNPIPINPTRETAPNTIRDMFTQNVIFTKEFWGGDYINHVGLLPAEQSLQQLQIPLWERLIRTSIITCYHRICADGVSGDPTFSQRWVDKQLGYSLRHRSKSLVLATKRWLIATIAAGDDEMGRNNHEALVGPKSLHQRHSVNMATIFDTDDFRNWGAHTMKDMVTNGYPIGDLLTAGQVEEFLREKGFVLVDNDQMQVEMTIPADNPEYPKILALADVTEPRTAGSTRPSPATATLAAAQRKRTSFPRSSPGRRPRPEKMLVTISVQTLLDKVVNLAICLGNSIGYPMQELNGAIAASVIRIGD